ncbi:MAG: PilZ domain-containing protein [Candidatus Omnitrophota bacterium]
MILLVEITFIILLSVVLYMIYTREINLSKKGSRKASLEEYWSGKDRRRHTRFKNKLEVSYSVAKKSIFKNNAYTIDISEGGLKILIAEKFGQGAVLEFLIVLPNSGRSAKVEGEVLWSEEFQGDDPSGRRLFYHGIKFLSTKEQSSSSVINYIRSLPSSSEV